MPEEKKLLSIEDLNQMFFEDPVQDQETEQDEIFRQGTEADQTISKFEIPKIPDLDDILFQVSAEMGQADAPPVEAERKGQLDAQTEFLKQFEISQLQTEAAEEVTIPRSRLEPQQSPKKGKLGKIISNVAFYTVLLAMLVGSAAFALSQNKDKTIFGYRFFYIKTTSMVPTYGQGDLIFVKAVQEVSSIQKDDVITFMPGKTTENNYLTHRVVEVMENYNGSGMTGFKTKGDANEDTDSFVVRPDKIVGVVKARVPKFGYVIAFVQGHLTLVVIVIILSVLLAVLLRFLITEYSHDRKREKRRAGT